MHRAALTGFETTRTGRRVSVAGAVYVTAWVVGLLTAPATPSATAPDGTIHGYYLEHGPAISFQSFLIHGLAGAALLVLAWTLPSATGASGRRRRTVAALGSGAAVVSFLQVAVAVVAVTGAEHDSAATSARLLDAINVADSLKLVLLAGFAAAATTAAARAGMLPRWVRGVAAVVVVLLPLGGAAFLVPSPVLTAMLYASLPLLLVWAGTTAFLVGRRAL
jgi:hypothetical protein